MRHYRGRARRVVSRSPGARGTVGVRVSAFLVRLLVVGLVAAIGGSCIQRENEPTVRATPTGEELSALVEASAMALVEQENFHFELEDLEGSTLLSPELELVWARGDVQPPAAARGYLGLAAAGAPTAPLETEVRVIDGEAFATNPLSGTWSRAQATELPVNLDGLADTIRMLMTGVGSLEYGGTRPAGSGEGDVVRGTIPASAFRALFDGALKDPAAEVRVEVTIAQRDGLPREIVIDGRLLHTDAAEAQRVLRLTRYGDAEEFGVPPGF